MDKCHGNHYECKSGSVIKRRCHSCKCDFPLDDLAPCRNLCCGLLYCRKCLTSRYKYSRVKAANLPTFNWKCPVCTRRCFCSECINAGVAVQIQKAISKTKVQTSTWYRKKRIRRAKKVEQVDELDQLNQHHQVDMVEKRSESPSMDMSKASSSPSAKGAKIRNKNQELGDIRLVDVPNFSPKKDRDKDPLPSIGGKISFFMIF